MKGFKIILLTILIIKRLNKKKEIKMCILAKPINHNFIVDKNKAEKFFKTSHKSSMEKVLAKAERFEKNLKK